MKSSRTLSPFSLFLALRFLQPKRTFVSIITLISVMGVTLGITVLILVIAVMTGFQRELRNKVLGFDPHILIRSVDDEMFDWQETLAEIEKTPGVEGAAPYVMGPVILEHDRRRLAPMIRGVDVEMEERVTKLTHYVQRGEMDLNGDSTVLGSDLAKRLGVDVGDVVTVYSPGNIGNMLEALKEAEDDPKALERVRTLLLPKDLTVTGIFSSGRQSYDAQFLLVPLHIGQELYGLDTNDTLHGIAVRTSDPDRAAEVRDAITERTSRGTYGTTWIEMNQSIFDAIAMERNVMFFLLMFIIVVAAFGIMNTLITVTTQKTREIGIMKALGASTGQIVWVFLTQGMIVGFFGNVAGVGLGMLVVHYRNEFKDWLAARLGVEVFPADVYQFSRIPAEVVPHDVAVICISAFAICALAALIPAYVAARLDPVKALRQE